LVSLLGEVAQATIQGLLDGSIYALAALGLSFIFSVIGVLNLAHGDFIMLGGFFGFLLASVVSTSSYGLLAVAAIIVFVFMTVVALGSVYEFVFVKPTLKRNPESILIGSILITVGTALIIENVGYDFLSQYSSHQGYFQIPFNLTEYTYRSGDIFISGTELIALIAIIVATASLYIVSKSTFLGRAMRAITQNTDSTRLMGVNVQRVSMLTFGLGSGFGAIAGVAIAMSTPIAYEFGLTYVVSLLSVMVLGGTRSYWGPLVGGLIIGLAQDLTQAPFFNPLNIPFLDLHISGVSYLSPVMSIVILIIVLMIRPAGLAGRAISTKV
jgi:branched-chain amino acid transport system permease protein